MDKEAAEEILALWDEFRGHTSNFVGELFRRAWRAVGRERKTAQREEEDDGQLG